MENTKHHKHIILILYVFLGLIIIFAVNKFSTRSNAYNSKFTNPLVGGSEKYYNAGAIKTIQAYNEAQSSTFSWLQKARDLIIQANQDFDSAEKIKLNTTLDTYIQSNKILAEKLSVIIKVKACYWGYSTIIENLENFATQTQIIQDLLQKETDEIDKNHQIEKICLNQLKNIANTSATQVDQLQTQMNEYNKQYKSNLIKNIEDPTWCLNETMSLDETITTDAKKSIDEFTNNHKNTLAALQSGDPEQIKDLCNQSKNDGQVSEKIGNSLQKLIDQLDENLKKGSKDNQNTKTTEWNEEAPLDSGVEYKPLFEKEELKILEEIDNNNTSLIKNIQQIKWKGKYNIQKYIDKLFNEFYGAPW